MERRAFIKTAALAGLWLQAGCRSLNPVPVRKGPCMAGFRAPPLEKVRVGLVGLGHRGSGAVKRLSTVPGVEITAVGDLYEDRVAKQVKALAESGKPVPKAFFGAKDAWRKLCESKDVDLVYICTPWLLHTPFGIAGIETLGSELALQVRQRTGKDPDVVVVTHAGGGNVTGTARGLRKVGCNSAKVVGASVDLSGLHMASDRDFNRKSFTTGHTGFGVPFATFPDRTDVPRNAARSLRYLDRYVLVTQGEVFYVTEALAQMEGLERGPAGNVSLAAAISVARELEEDKIVVVQETEYTGAGKHPMPQLTFARENGVVVRRGDPAENKPGSVIVIPEHPGQIVAKDYSLNDLRRSYLRNAIKTANVTSLNDYEFQFLVDETSASPDFVRTTLEGLGVKTGV